jgi:hypothetical protein
MPALLDVARYRVLFADCDPMRIMAALEEE